MIDFLKLRIKDNATYRNLKENSSLVWDKSIDTLTSHELIQTDTIKAYKGILFCFNERTSGDYVDIIFKPHYLFNDNLHNSNDFSISECMRVIKILENELSIDPLTASVINIEFGVNVLSPIDVKNLINYIKYHLKNEFLRHNGLTYSKVSTSTNRNGKWNTHKLIKAYNKGIQFPEFCDANTFRFEVKSNRAAYIQKTLGVYNLGDLYELLPYAKMAQITFDEFKDVLIIDPYARPELTKREQGSLNNLLNSDTWYHIHNSTNRNKFSKSKARYEYLIGKDENNLKKKLSDTIRMKLLELSKGCSFYTPP